MKDQAFAEEEIGRLSRRVMVRRMGTAAAAALFAPQVMAQQTRPVPPPASARTAAPRPAGPDNSSGSFNIRDFGAVCDGVADDSAALNAALAHIIGLSFPFGELIIPNRCRIASNVTIPQAVALRFVFPGRFIPASTRIITIQGMVTAGVQTIFDLSAGGAISFSGNIVQKRYIAEWWGLPYDSTTDAVPRLKAMIDGVPNYAQIEFHVGQPPRYLTFRQTLRINERVGLRLTAVPAIREIPQLVIQDASPWTTTRTPYSSGNVLLSFQNCGHCTVEGFWFKTGVVSCGVEIVGEAGSRISTGIIVQYNRVTNVSGNAGFRGVQIAPSGEQNGEFMKIIGNFIEGGGARQGQGLYAGGGSNNHGHVIEDNDFTNLAIGITAGWTGYTARHNHFTNNALDIEITHLSYPTRIVDNGSEISRQFLRMGAAGGESTVIVEANRLAGLGANGVAWIELREAIGPTTIMGNDYQNYDRNNSRLYSFPWSGAANPGSSVTLIGNNYGNMLLQGMPVANFVVRTGNNAAPVRLPINIIGEALPGAR